VSQYYVLKGRSTLSHDQPWSEDDVLWNPGQDTSQVFLSDVQVLEKMFSIESGLVDPHIDEIEVDPDRLEAFARRLLEELARTTHEVKGLRSGTCWGQQSSCPIVRGGNLSLARLGRPNCSLKHVSST